MHCKVVICTQSQQNPHTFSDHKPITLLQLPSSRNINAFHIRRLLQLPEITLRQRYALVLQARQTLVVPLKQPAVDDTADTSNRGQGDDDTHGGVVVRCRPLEVSERGPDRGGVAEAVDEGQSCCAFGWRAGNGVCNPCVGL